MNDRTPDDAPATPAPAPPVPPRPFVPPAASEPRGASRRRLALRLLVLLALAWTATGLVATLPVGEGNDEHSYLKSVAFTAIEARPADQTREDFTAAQHPPLYFAALALVYAPLRGDESTLPPRADDAPWVLPLERRIALPLRAVEPDGHAAAARASTDPPTTGDGPPDTRFAVAPYALRLVGVLQLLVLAWVVFSVLDRLFPDRRDVAALAAAASLLVPQLAGTFATVNNDQFAALFGTLGFAAVAAGAAHGRAHRARTLVPATILLGLGCGSKAWVLGAIVAAAWLLVFHERASWSRRFRSLVVLGLGPLLVAAPWFAYRTMQAGSPLGTGALIARWPMYVRAVPPDMPFGYLRELAQVVPTWLARIGFSDVQPPEAWMTVARAWPLLLLASVGAALVARRVPDRDRALVHAFLVGALVQTAALAVFAHRYAGAHGRYFQPLLLPGTAALVAGLPHLVGRRARGVLAAFVVLMAAGGPLMLHAGVLPRFGEHHRWRRMPDVVRYVDLGAPHPPGTPRDAVVTGGLLTDLSVEEVARARQRGRVTTGGAPPIRVAFSGLDPDGLHLLGVRLLPYGSHAGDGLRSSVRVTVGGEPLAGPLGSFAVDGWLDHPVAVAEDGTLDVEFARAEGVLAAVAEVVVRRLPLRDGTCEPTADGAAYRVAFDGEARGLPPLELLLRDVDGRVGASRPLARDADGVGCVLPAPPGEVATLLVRTPPVLSADVKLAAWRADDVPAGFAPRLRYAPLALDATGAAPGDLLAALPAAWIPPGRSTLRLLDGDGRDVSSDFTFTCAPGDPDRDVDRAPTLRREGDAWVADRVGPPPAELLLELRAGATTGAPALVDRLQIRVPAGWEIPLR